MKIVFLTDNFPPEVNAPASRTYEHCKLWIEAGADVTVITCQPNFPQGRVYPGYKNRFYQKEVMDGIKVIRVWSYITANEGFLKRSLDYLSFAVAGAIAGLFQKADVIVATSPQFFTTFAGYALSVFKRKPWLFELRDLWPESLVAVGATKNQKLVDFLERVELYLYRKAARVVAVTPAFKRNLVGRGICEAKIDVVPNGVDLSRYQVSPKDQSLIDGLGLRDKFIVGYIGTHGMAHGLDFILNSISGLEDERLHFLFVGDGAEKKSLQQRAADLGLQNVTMLDPISKNEVPRYMSIMDLALVPLRKSDTFKSVIPSKIFEAAGMEKPIFLGVEGQAQEIIEEHRAGLCFEPENAQDFTDKLLRLVNDRELYETLQDGCRQLARTYDRSILAGRMLEILRNTR